MTTTHAERNEPVDELTADELDLVAGGIWGFSGWGGGGSGSATTGGPLEQVSLPFRKMSY